MKQNSNLRLIDLHKNMIKFYNTDKKYFKKIATRDNFHYRLIPAILEALKNKDIKILDAGCGTGSFISFLSTLGYKHIEGLDKCELFIKHAKGNNKIKFHKKDILDFYPNSKYDCVIATDFLEHAIYPDKIITKLSAILKDDGLLIIQGPNTLQLISQETNFMITKLKLFITKLTKYFLFKKVNLIYRKPKLDKETHIFDDSDACYLINPIDIKFILKKNKFKILYLSTFFNPRQKFKGMKRIIVKMLIKIPIIKYLGGCLFVVAVKIPNKNTENNLKLFRKTLKKIERLH